MNYPSRSLAGLLLLLAAALACSLPLASGAPSTIRRGPGSFDLPDPAAGLAQRAGYRLHLTLTFTGTKDGQPFQWETDIDRKFVREPSAQFTTFKNSGADQSLEMAFGTVGETHYFQPAPDQACSVTWGDRAGGTSSPLEPAGLLPPVLGAESAGTESIDGVAAAHYTFDQRALARGTDIQAVGQLWIAQDGGEVARYLLRITGGESYFGPGIKGEQTWKYDVVDAAGQTSMELPAACPAVLSEIPILPDATNLTRLPDFLSFSTVTSLVDVVSFYQSEMKTLGWKQVVEAQPAAGREVLIFAHPNGRRAIATFESSGAAVLSTIQVIESTPASPGP